MFGVILAAGEGSRLSHCITERYMKPLAPVNGAPLITYPARSLTHGGAGSLLVVANIYNYQSIHAALRNAGITDYTVAVNPEFGEACLSLARALERLRGHEFLLSMSDHLYLPSLVEKLVRGCDGDICVAGDRSPKLIEVEEATKIASRGRKALRFSKRLQEYSYIDMGVFYITGTASRMLGDYITSPHEMSLSSLWNRVIDEGVLEIRVVDETGEDWMEVDDEADYFRATAGPGRELAWRILSTGLQQPL